LLFLTSLDDNGKLYNYFRLFANICIVQADLPFNEKAASIFLKAAFLLKKL